MRACMDGCPGHSMPSQRPWNERRADWGPWPTPLGLSLSPSPDAGLGEKVPHSPARPGHGGWGGGAGFPPSSRELSLCLRFPTRLPSSLSPGTPLSHTHKHSCRGQWEFPLGVPTYQASELSSVPGSWKAGQVRPRPPSPQPPAGASSHHVLPGQADLRWGLQGTGPFGSGLGDPDSAPHPPPGKPRPGERRLSAHATLPERHERAPQRVTYWSARHRSPESQAPAWGGRGEHCCGLLAGSPAPTNPSALQGHYRRPPCPALHSSRPLRSCLRGGPPLLPG